jgi:hypothetical protein
MAKAVAGHGKGEVAVAVVVVVAAMAHNFHFMQCLLHWMGVGGSG